MPDMTGAMGTAPPRIVKTIPQLVPRVDADGNELDGIRSPLMSAPLGSYVGWNIFAAGFEQGRFAAIPAAIFPLPPPRPSAWPRAIRAPRWKNAIPAMPPMWQR